MGGATSLVCDFAHVPPHPPVEIPALRKASKQSTVAELLRIACRKTRGRSACLKGSGWAPKEKISPGTRTRDRGSALWRLVIEAQTLRGGGGAALQLPAPVDRPVFRL